MSKKQRARKQRAERLAASAASSPVSSMRATPSPVVPREEMRVGLVGPTDEGAGSHQPVISSPSQDAGVDGRESGNEASSSDHETDMRATSFLDSKPEPSQDSTTETMGQRQAEPTESEALQTSQLSDMSRSEQVQSRRLSSTMSLSEETPEPTSELESSQQIDEAFNELWETSIDDAEANRLDKALDEFWNSGEGQEMAEALAVELAEPSSEPKSEEGETSAEGAFEKRISKAPLGDPTWEQEAKEPDVYPGFEAEVASEETLATRKIAKPKGVKRKGNVRPDQVSGSTLETTLEPSTESQEHTTGPSDPARFMSTGSEKQWNSSSISGEFTFKFPRSTTQMADKSLKALVPSSPLKSSFTPDTAEGPNVTIFGQPSTGSLSTQFTFNPSQVLKDADTPSPKSQTVDQSSAVASSFLFAPSRVPLETQEEPGRTSLAKESPVLDTETPTPDCAVQMPDSELPAADSAIPMAYRSEEALFSPPQTPDISSSPMAGSPEPLHLNAASVDNELSETLSVTEQLKNLSISQPETLSEPLPGSDGKSYRSVEVFSSPPQSPNVSVLPAAESPEPLQLSTISVDNDASETLSVMGPLKRLSISEPETLLEPQPGPDGRSYRSEEGPSSSPQSPNMSISLAAKSPVPLRLDTTPVDNNSSETLPVIEPLRRSSISQPEILFEPLSSLYGKSYREEEVLSSPPQSPDTTISLGVDSPEALGLDTTSAENGSSEILSVVGPLRGLSIAQPEALLEAPPDLEEKSGEDSDSLMRELFEDEEELLAGTRDHEYMQMLSFDSSQGGPSMVDDYEAELMRDIRGPISPEREQAAQGYQTSDDEQGSGNDEEPVEESNSEEELKPAEKEERSVRTTADLYEPSTAQPSQSDEETQIPLAIKKGSRQLGAEQSGRPSPVWTRGPPNIPRAGDPCAGFIFKNHKDIAAELSIKTSISNSRQALQLGDLREALYYAEMAVESSRVFGFAPLCQRSRFWEGVALYKSNEYDKALLAFQEAQKCRGIYDEGETAESFVPKTMIKSSIPWSKRTVFKGPSVFVKTATDDDGEGVCITRDEKYNLFRHTSFFEWRMDISADRQRVRTRVEYLTPAEPISAEEAFEYLTDDEASSLKEQLCKAKLLQIAKARKKRTLGPSVGASTRSQAETDAIKLRIALSKAANKRSPNDAELSDIYAISEQTRNGRLLVKPIFGEVAEGSLSQAGEQEQPSQDVEGAGSAADSTEWTEASESSELELRDSREREVNALNAQGVAGKSEGEPEATKDAPCEEPPAEPKQSLWSWARTKLFGGRE